MRVLIGWSVLLLATGCVFAQHRGGGGYAARGGFPSVVFPGGTSATTPGVTRFSGSVVFPGGGGPQFGAPIGITDPTFASRLGATVGGGNQRRPGVFGRNYGGRRQGNAITVVPYAFPVYMGGYGFDNGYGYGYGYGYPTPDQMVSDVPQQPNVVVVYPQQAPPVIINQYGPGQGPGGPAAQPEANEAPEATPAPQPAASPMPEPSGYLIAFKDHTIYKAVAYWVEGDTLHYFTTGSTHNQVSLALVDRALTERLNQESGVDLRLPAPAQAQ